MSISIKTDAWHVKDANGEYRDTAIFSTTLPQEADQLIADTRQSMDDIAADINTSLAEFDAEKQSIAATIAGLETYGTDPELATTGMPADAKAAGDKIGELKNALSSTSDGDLGNRWIVFKHGRYFAPSTTIIGETISYGNSDTLVCAICPCEVGDVFTIKLRGPTGVARGWFICDSNMVALDRAVANITPDGEEIEITQTGAAYFCCNNLIAGMPSGYYVYKGKSVRSFIDDIRRLNYYQSINETYDLNGLTKSGVYAWTSSHVPQNAPTTSAISGNLLNIYVNGGAAYQIQFRRDRDNPLVFTRALTTSGWGSWVRLVNDNILNTVVANINELINDINNSISNNSVESTGIPSIITSALEGEAECETSATTIIRYAKNLMTLTGSPADSRISRDENGAFILNASPTASSYINIQTGIKLKGGVTYRVDGSPQITGDSCGLCVYINGTRIGYDQGHNGATFTREEDCVADLKLRVMEGSIYTDAKFYPILCENSTVQRGSPSELTLLEGNNEVVGLDYNPLTVTYNQSKILVLENEVAEIRSNFSLDNLVAYQDENGYYSSSFSVVMKQPERNNGRIVGINSKHISGSSHATITLSLETSGGSAVYTSRTYDIGGDVEPKTLEFKAPPFVSGYDYLRVTFTIPEGTSIEINDFYSFEAAQARHNDDCGIKWHAHAGFPSMMPGNTIPSFQMAGKLGFSSCITIPKFTSDGVGVCFHDDSSISGDLYWMDGTSITGTDDVGISNYTYDYITANFRIKSTRYGILHVPTIDEFFKVCSMYNMSPIFSVHSAGFGATWDDGFQEIRRLAEKWNVLDKIWIKSGSGAVQSAATTVFGTDIAGRILIRGQTSTWDPLEQAKTAGLVPRSGTSAKDGICPLVFELFQAAATDEAIALGLNEGFKVSVAVTGSLTGAVMKAFIEKGVTEFTDDYHCSLGLDWMN